MSTPSGNADDTQNFEPPEKDKTSMMTLLYDKINELFGQGQDQYFALEYPGRVLDMGNYTYDGSDGVNSQEVKPVAVAEAEFKLSDDLFAVSQIVGGPKGNSLATTYANLIESFIPSQAANKLDAPLAKDQDAVTAWLLDLVPNWIPPMVDLVEKALDDLEDEQKAHIPGVDNGSSSDDASNAKKNLKGEEVPTQVRRIELYQTLLDYYEDMQFKWKKFKINARPAKKTDKDSWDAYERILSVYQPVIDAKLEAAWSMLVIRGQYHRIRQYLGICDITSASELLLTAKANLRASVSRSVDDSQDIYPVSFSPATWANELTTDFQPVDLMMDYDLLSMQLADQETQRRDLMLRIATLQSGQQGTAALQGQVDAARTTLDAAQDKLISGYSDATGTLIKAAFKIAASPESLSLQLLALGVNSSDIDKITDANKELEKSQSSYLASSEALTRAEGVLAGAKASDATLAIGIANDQLNALTVSIERLKEILSTATKDTPGVPIYTPAHAGDTDPATATVTKQAGKDGDVMPAPPTPMGKASSWQTVQVEYSRTDQTSIRVLETSESHTSWSASFWIGSASGSSDHTSSDSRTTDNKVGQTIKIAFNAMKVDINRPWFDAGLLANTANYCNRNANAKHPISVGSDFSNNMIARKAGKMPSDNDTIQAELNAANASQLPAYPSGFIIAKDVTMIVQMTSTTAQTKAKELMDKSGSGGGCFCFSYNTSSEKDSSHHGAYSASIGDFLRIKMPGPQLIGWLMQVVPKDECVDYAPLDKSLLDRMVPVTPTPVTPAPVPIHG